jgi:acetyl esterase/lipase
LYIEYTIPVKLIKEKRGSAMPILYTVCEYKKVGDCSIKCDVYPGDIGAPVVVYIHGGALILGGRGELPELTLNPFIKAGYWLVSIDYRLAPETMLPEIINDVRNAIGWVRGEGAKIFDYNADKLAVLGESAGGYLTLMAGTFQKKPNVLVSLYGYGDLLGDWYCKPSPFYCAQPPVSFEAAKNAMEDAEHAEVRKAERALIYLRSRQTGTWTSLVSGLDIDYDRDKIIEYCPIFNISDDYPPTILLHGDEDTDVPYEQSMDMYNALKARGLTAELVTYTGGEHGFDWDKNDPYVPGMIEKALSFVGAYI